MREPKFKRVTSFSVPGRYINKTFSCCPLCKKTPNWSLRTIGMLAIRYQFRCESCEGVISTPLQEFTSPLSNTRVTWYGIKKEIEGKSLEPYFRIEDGGIHQFNWDKVGHEFTADQLNRLNA